MFVPMIHHWIGRDDMACVLREIAAVNPQAAEQAAVMLQRGDVDAVLDLPVTLDVVRGLGGRPAPLPLSILWYVPVRAALRERGESNVRFADFTATIPVAFHSMRSIREAQPGESGLEGWMRSITSLPRYSLVRAKRSAQLAAMALWWVGCYPERVQHLGGVGMLRAYVDFAAGAFADAAGTLCQRAPDAADIYRQVSARAALVSAALTEVKRDYLGAQAHDQSRRLDRFLTRLRPAT